MLKSFFLVIEGFLTPFANALKTSALGYFIAIGAGSLAVIQFSIDFWERQEERAERRASAVERAWQSLLTPMGGDTGKGNSLNYLFQSKAIIAGGTLSCKNMGLWDDNLDHCQELPGLSGVIFPPILAELPADNLAGNKTVEMARIVYPVFEDVVISDSDLKHAVIGEEFGQGTQLRRTRLSEALIVSDTEASFEYSDLTNSFVSERVLSAVSGSNLSGIFMIPSIDGRFENGHQWQQRPIPLDGFENWAWADNPPKTLVQGSQFRPMAWVNERWIDDSYLILCDPRYRAEPDTSSSYVHLNEQFTPHFDLVRQFEIQPVGDGTIRHPNDHLRWYFPSILISLEERAPFCYRLHLDEAKQLWPQAYAIRNDPEYFVQRFTRMFDKHSLLDAAERQSRIVNHNEPPPEPQP